MRSHTELVCTKHAIMSSGLGPSTPLPPQLSPPSLHNSVLLQSPPHAVTPDKRKQAEAIFMELKKSKIPYNACKFILGECYHTCKVHTQISL